MAKKEEKTELVKTEKANVAPVSMIEEMEKRFENFFQHPFSMMMRPAWPAFDMPKLDVVSPSVDVFEDNGQMVIKAEIPGMSKEDVNVTVSENTITISGEKKQEEKVDKKDYYRVERSYGSFCRSFRLPPDVKSDKVSASFKDGVLEVRLPRSKETTQKKIKID